MPYAEAIRLRSQELGPPTSLLHGPHFQPAGAAGGPQCWGLRVYSQIPSLDFRPRRGVRRRASRRRVRALLEVRLRRRVCEAAPAAESTLDIGFRAEVAG